MSHRRMFGLNSLFLLFCLCLTVIAAPTAIAGGQENSEVNSSTSPESQDPLVAVAGTWKSPGQGWLAQSGPEFFVITKGMLMMVEDTGMPSDGGTFFASGEVVFPSRLYIAIETVELHDPNNGDVYTVPAGSALGISPEGGISTNAACSVACGNGTYACCRKGSNSNPTCQCNPNPPAGGRETNEVNRAPPASTAQACDAGGVGAITCSYSQVLPPPLTPATNP